MRRATLSRDLDILNVREPMGAVFASVLFSAVVAVATVVLAWATVRYMHAQRQPYVSGYFNTDKTWIYLVIQNTGTGSALETSFSIDLNNDELRDIWGAERNEGKGYIVHEDLSFLDHIKHLAPGQVIRHRWLFLAYALRDGKPRPCAVTVRFRDQWRRKRLSVDIPFDVGQFGSFDDSHIAEPTALEEIRDKLNDVASELRAANRREHDLHEEQLRQVYESQRHRAQEAAGLETGS